VRRALVPLLVCLLAALVVSGCGAVGRVTNGDASHGKQLFSSSSKPSEPSCASCHTLADAKSQGTVGPNLDDAFSSDKSQGFSVQTMTDVVRGQIAYPEQPMPANLYRGQDAKDVATYIAKCAANPGCGVTASNPAPTGTTTTTTTTAGTTTTSTGGGGSTVAVGKKVFASAGCGGCHTLKDAGSSGNVGPNLDQLKPAEAIVEKQVRNGRGAMPAFKSSLSAAQIKAVATYVSTVAGK
jgi:mono/diheme cytochrome c family protein